MKGRIGPYWESANQMFRQQERLTRIFRLQSTRGMTFKAAATVVDAAMFGIGCIEGQVRARIQAEQEAKCPTINSAVPA